MPFFSIVVSHVTLHLSGRNQNANIELTLDYLSHNRQLDRESHNNGNGPIIEQQRSFHRSTSGSSLNQTK